MPTEFVHLHVHSDYSVLDGACSISGLAELAAQNGMRAVAVTDHGYMGGALEAYKEMNKNKVKPIIGVETYVSPTFMSDKDNNREDIRGYHLILLASDFTGYQNLCKLATASVLEGFYYNPRIDKKILAEHSKGLIGMSACLSGEIARAIQHNKIKDAKKILAQYLDIFGKGNFYLEVMEHGIAEQKLVNKELVLLSREFGIPLVATNDVHYLKKEHAKSHELMLCIQTHSIISDEKRMKMHGDQFYFKTGDEMAAAFPELPEALKNTLEVAERCNVSIPTGTDVNHYPVYQVGPGETQKQVLRKICIEGMRERYGFDASDESKLDEEQKKILQRMDYELGVIDNSKYSSYFLVVWDFIKYARDNKIPVGPGRGSGAGSIVAYLSKITDVDPLRYKLLFERFLNPERVSPPDFDIDFCELRRYEVIEYVRRKYGKDSVAQLGTYGTLKPKAVVKDIARVIGRTFAEGNQLTKLIPEKKVVEGEGEDTKITLDSAIEQSRELREFMEKEPWVREVIEYAKPLEDLIRNMTIHAAGVIIGDQPLSNLVPLAVGGKDEVITQYAAKYCEDLGLLKMDFLGLSTLTIIDDAVKRIKEHNGDIDIERIPLDDKKAFELLNRGDTIAVFQLESTGMQDLCKKFGVDKIEDIIALIALYRPGPMQFIPEFISRKSGQTKIEYDHPAMEKILNETYGIMLYQEQVMQAVQEVAGFSLGQADILRRAIGKKKVKELAAQHEKFIQGCAANKISKERAEQIWEKIAKFAGYGFNKSHSAAYGIIAYRTAYLKANFPVEFMAAVLSNVIDSSEKVAFFIQECKEMNIPVMPPDVNRSDASFTVDGKGVRFGLAAIKGVGTVAAQAVIDSRRKEGEFKSLIEFCERVGPSVNMRMLENLARAGAFGGFGLKRSQLVKMFEPAMALSAKKVADKKSGQGSLFDMFAGDEKNEMTTVQVPDIPEFHEQEILKDEKELLGFYVTGHPLGEYENIIKTYSTSSISKVSELPMDSGVRIGGIINTISVKISKKKTPFAFLQVEDLEGAIECIAWPDIYEKLDKEILKENVPVFIEGHVDISGEGDARKAKIIITSVYPMSSVQEKYTKEVHIRIYEASTGRDKLDEIQKICGKYPGESRTIFCITCASGEIAFIETSKKFNIRVNNEFVNDVRNLLGEHALHFKADLTPIPQKKRWKDNGNGNGRRFNNGGDE